MSAEEEQQTLKELSEIDNKALEILEKNLSMTLCFGSKYMLISVEHLLTYQDSGFREKFYQSATGNDVKGEVKGWKKKSKR